MDRADACGRYLGDRNNRISGLLQGSYGHHYTANALYFLVCWAVSCQLFLPQIAAFLSPEIIPRVKYEIRNQAITFIKLFP